MSGRSPLQAQIDVLTATGTVLRGQAEQPPWELRPGLAMAATVLEQMVEQLTASRTEPWTGVTVPRAALEELATEATLVAAAFDELIPHDTHHQSKIANLIDALGVEGL